MASKLFGAHFDMNNNISNGRMSNQAFIFISDDVLSKRVQSTKLCTVFPTKDKEYILMEDYYYFQNDKKSSGSSKQICTIDGGKPLNLFTRLTT